MFKNYILSFIFSLWLFWEKWKSKSESEFWDKGQNSEKRAGGNLISISLKNKSLTKHMKMRRWNMLMVLFDFFIPCS